MSEELVEIPVSVELYRELDAAAKRMGVTIREFVDLLVQGAKEFKSRKESPGKV
jgi:hypothetical protein